MILELADWIIIGAYVVFAVGVGIYFSKRAGKNITEFFISGRNLPWWIAGTSIIATTFAADTPLAITGMVVRNGIAGNWLWWNFAICHMLAVFFFAKLWRRAEILTDVELIEIRYSGKPASLLRGFRALYEGIIMNGIVMGWVTLAMTKIMSVFFHFDKWLAIVICAVIAISYTILSGFWGVVITDFIQFFIAMFGCIVLAFISVDKLGGIETLRQNLDSEVFNFFPEIGGSLMPVTTFVAYIAVNWWASKVADGGGYIAQRMFSAKNEKHSILSMLWYNIGHYALRPWPWIIVALFSMVAYQNLSDPELGYPKMIADYMPTGLKGLMVASFLAAFMSTIDSQINWGSSLIVNDFYRKFVNKDASQQHYVRISRIATVLLLLTSAVITYSMTSIESAWKLFYQLTAGIGGVYIMRWFWWRINAWSEITAWVSSSVAALSINFIFSEWEYGIRLISTAFFSTSCWLIATLVTKPVDEKKLLDFYNKVKPRSFGWRKISKDYTTKDNWGDILDWVLGTVMIYSILFSIGKFILGFYTSGLIFTTIAIVCFLIIYRDLSRRGWEVTGL